MDTSLTHFHRLSSSRLYHNYPAPPIRLSNNYYPELIPQPHPTLIQQYFSFYNEPIAPLDLSVKSTIPITPPCTPPPSHKRKSSENENKERPTKIFRHFEDTDSNNDLQNEVEKAEKRKIDEQENSNDSDSPEAKKIKFTKQFFEELQTCLPDEFRTPSKSNRESPAVIEIRDIDDKPKKSPKQSTIPKKSKAVRRLTFDEDKTSPVSGTIIRDLAEDETLVVKKVKQLYIFFSFPIIIRKIVS